MEREKDKGGEPLRASEREREIVRKCRVKKRGREHRTGRERNRQRVQVESDGRLYVKRKAAKERER